MVLSVIPPLVGQGYAGCLWERDHCVRGYFLVKSLVHQDKERDIFHIH